MHRLALAALALLLAAPAQGQSALDVIDQGQAALQRSFSAADADGIRRARGAFLRATSDRTHGYLAHYYAGLAGLRLANLTEETDEALGYVDDGIEHLEAVVEARPRWAEGHALLASLYGRKAGLRPMTGMVIGPKASREIERAQELAPDNPRVVYIAASSQYFRPAMWGGSKAEGIAGFRRAVTLFDRAPAAERGQPSWGHEEALSWLGIALARDGELTEARRLLTRSLQVNPDYVWVRDTILPQLDERIAASR